MRNNPKIIYLNGPSSSGKSTIARALQNALEEPYLYIGIDLMVYTMPEKINDWTGNSPTNVQGYSWKSFKDAEGNSVKELQEGPYAKKVADSLIEVAIALAKGGHSIIIDDVSFGKKEIDVWKKRLASFSVLWVGIKAPIDVLEERERSREDQRALGSARGQFTKVHEGVTYDLEIDTSLETVEKCVLKIKRLVEVF